jgi:NADH-quinone oxidoreductase subunit F
MMTAVKDTARPQLGLEATPASLDAILASHPRRKDVLLSVLQDIQVRMGYVSPDFLPLISQHLGVPESVIQGVLKFYDLFSTRAEGTAIHFCDDVVCYLTGAPEVRVAIEDTLGAGPHGMSQDGAFSLHMASCLGGCHRGPGMLIGNSPQFDLTPDKARQIISLARRERLVDSPMNTICTPKEERVLLSNCGVIDPASLSDYVAAGGFESLKRALAMGPGWLTNEVKTSGLVGRGGAAFPTGLKWELAARAVVEQGAIARGPRAYIVCNADESETGTFKDRIFLGGDPLRVIEGMIMAAFAVGADYGYMYVRWEYPQVVETVLNVLDQARQAGYLGSHILGTDFSFDIEVRRGAGAYVCGEETALFESIEGKRGEARPKPPYPTTHGLFGRPTVINNVETLGTVPLIVKNGANWYKSMGTPKSPGTKLFCVSGRVERPGLYELPLGVSLRHLIYDLAGGVSNGRKLQAVLCGGAAGTFIGPEQLDMALDYQAPPAIGATMGSGAVMVIDDQASMWEVLRRIARFFERESCGRCFPCQVGTSRQLEIVTRMSEGRGNDNDIANLTELGGVMRLSSTCGLGQSAAIAIFSGLKLMGLT